ncbi:ankyrin repeat domain-containing protein [Aspergillus ibericus CBS 121593]|uniref:Ankyrin n=1 Tax=Aspergillus ibericus CBS 121593 TaxID=1448316 RepID=A0A395GPG5_9EURO|nr:ankyrin [Aspergillus ibericus CBS 121593]RAK97236.1 ankyrin [Aspergillus ibericus CBS 121593]
MRFPIEILRQIIQSAVDLVPIRDLFQARLVNTFFDEEIITFFLDSPRLEEEAFCFPTSCRTNKAIKGRWTEFPDRLKRLYLYRKIQKHPRSRCAFTCWVQEVLDHQLGTTPEVEQKDEWIAKLVDVTISGHYEPANLFSPDRCEWWMKRVRAMFQDSMVQSIPILLACSAIKRGDCAELQTALQNGLQMQRLCVRFGVITLDVAARKGNKEIARTLVEHKCPMWYDVNWNTCHVVPVAAVAQNKEALEVWIEHLYQTHPSSAVPAWNCAEAMEKLARRGLIEMMEFMMERYPATLHDRIGALSAAIDSGQCAAAQWLLARLDAPLPPDRGRWLLTSSLKCCPRAKRTRMVQLLLEHGVDPNGDARFQTPLDVAVAAGDVSIATMLVQYGANFNQRLPPGSRLMKPSPLMLAVRQRSAPLIRMLLENEADRTYTWKRRKYTVYCDVEEVRNLEKVLRELGWDEEKVKQEAGDYWVLGEKLRNPRT